MRPAVLPRPARYLIMKKQLLALATTAVLTAASAHASIDPDLQRAKRGPVSNSYVVTIDLAKARQQYGKANGRDIAEAMVREVGNAPLRHVYERAMQGFAAGLTAGQANALRKNKSVLRVDQDQYVAVAATQSSAPWGLDRIDQPTGLNGQFTYPNAAANAAHIYVLDTGILASNSQFTGRLGTGRNFIANEDGAINATNTNDCNGHGTHVSGTAAGTTYGVAKQATVHAVRVLGCDGGGTVSGAIAGIDWVISHVSGQRSAGQAWPAVINLSLSSSTYTPFNDAVKKAVANRVLVVAAAGNSNADACAYSPAGTPEILTVGATSSNDTRASFSNFGSCVDVFAPGVGILSSVHTGTTATASYSGTSMAAPHVAGVVAHHLTLNPSATQEQVATLLINESVKDIVGSEGTGSPDRLLQMPAGTVLPPAPPPEQPATAPCSNCQPYTVTASAGSVATLPSSAGFRTTQSMQLGGYLRAPSTLTGRVFLDKQNAKTRKWANVASSTTGSSIDLTYSAGAGTYRWRVQVVSGSGSYTFYGQPN